MATLADFNSSPSMTLEDLLSGKEKPAILNSPTINNMAAHAAVLSDPNSVPRTYGNVSAELSKSGTSNTLDNVIKDTTQLQKSADYSELQKVLVDPTIPIDVKQQAMDNYINSAQPASRTLSSLVTEQAASQSVGPNENDETTATTVDVAGILDGVDTYRGWVQKQINFNETVKNRDALNTIGDFIESMVPFLSASAVAKTRTMKGDNPLSILQSLTVLGESKNDVRKAIQAMPIEQRYNVAQKLIDVVKASGGSITFRPNELQILDQLTSFLDGNGYSNQDRFTDDIFSLMDAVLPFSGILGKVFKGTGEATKEAAIMERASKVEDRIIQQKLPEVKNILDGALKDKNINTIKTGTAEDNLNLGLVNKITGKSSNLIGNGGISDGELSSLHDILTKSLTDKFRTPDTKQPLTGDMAQMVEDLKNEGFDYSQVYNEVKKTIEKIVTRTTLPDPNLNKKIIDATKQTFKDKRIYIPKTYNATSTQIIRQVMEESNLRRLSVSAPIDHMSISQTMKDGNAGKARSINAMMEADQSDDSARILYGASRKDAIANDRLPEVKNEDGSVRNKVRMDEAGPNPDEAVVNAILSDRGRIDLADKEKILTRDQVKDDWREINGLVPRKEMGTIGDLPTGVSFDMVYGPSDGGFVSAPQGIQQVLFGLRKYGITSKDIEILSKDVTGKYIPVKNVPNTPGNYLVRVKYNYDFAPGDIRYTTLQNSNWKLLEPRLSLTDGKAGSILQHIIPASAIVNKVIYNSASAASDASSRINKRLIQLAEQYATNFKGLDKREKALVDMYRIEANDKGLKFDPLNLKARGFTDKGINTLRSWKTITDTMWVLENMDLNKSMRARGWQRLVDQVNDTDLIVRPRPNRGWGEAVKVYDPQSNQIVKLSKDEVKQLYEKGGTLAETRGTIEFGDDSFDVVAISQNSEANYTRAIRDNDPTLPYRDGYYPIKYKDPIFITKKFTKKDGGTYWKAIATAESHNDATRLLQRLRTTDATGEYVARYDYRRGTEAFDNAEWSSIVSSGRSAQRIRGERLANASSTTDLNHVHIDSPEESLIKSIRSLSSRTAFRDWIETTKTRWMNQYGDLIEKQNGWQSLWPEDVRQIGKRNIEHSNLLVKDAKTTWRFVNAMENGFVNSIDDFTRNFLNNMADLSGKKGWTWIEKLASNAAEGSPSHFVRRRAFRLLLAANPLRQLPIQSLQAVPILLATNPLGIPRLIPRMMLLDYLSYGGDVESFGKTVAKAFSGWSTKEAKQLAKDWEASGFEASVEAHTLIRDQLANLVDRTPWQKIGSKLAIPLNLSQKYGFNAGENLLMRSVWLSEYDLLKKTGKTIDAAALENLNARVRNLTLNMNKAGELPYNENLFSAAFQFFQAPHKAFSQIIFGHTGLSTWDRLKLGASYIAVYGIGASALTDMVMKVVGNKDPDTKDLVEGGLFNLALNKSLSNLFGQDVKSDFSDSLRLLQFPDVFKFWEGLMGSDVADALSQPASASLVFGSNPRLTNFIRQMMRPFTVDDNKKLEELKLTAKSFAELFSGASNVFKAIYALEHHKTISSRGRVIDSNVNDVEAILKAFGFSTMDEVHQYAFDEASYQASGKYKDDVKQVVDEISKHLAEKNISNDEAAWWFDMMAEAQRVFKNDPIYMQEFMNQIHYKALNGDTNIFDRLMSMSGFMSPQDFEDLVNKSNLSDGQKSILIKSKNMFEGK